MSKIVLKKGSSESLKKEKLQDGMLSFTTDDGKIHLDYLDENDELKRKTFYSGKLTVGSQTFDGSQDIDINFDGAITRDQILSLFHKEE